MRVRADDVTYRYPGADRPVIAGVTFDVACGEFVALLGPSGSGKTTLMSLIGGLLLPEKGELAILDEGATPGGPLWRRDPVDAVAWVLQTTNVLPDRTVADNVALGCYADGHSWRSAHERAAAELGTVGLQHRQSHLARQLSGGEVQRLAVARALSSSRPVILADEPTGQLDHHTTGRVLNALLSHSHGRTVIVVTHDNEVAARCDRVFVMRDGALHGAAA